MNYENGEIDLEFSQMCADTHFSGNFDGFGDDEQIWIDNGEIKMAVDQ